MPRLFHVSEKSDIKIFEPRPPPSAQAGINYDAVWAIDHDHLPHYLMPRDCPRVTLRRGPKTSESDALKFFADGSERIIAIEMDWYERVKSTQLYLYEFPLKSFALVDSIAGYYVSRETVAPSAIHKIENLIEKIIEHGYKLRLLPNLWPLSDAAVNSTVQFSIIRMRNAKPK